MIALGDCLQTHRAAVALLMSAGLGIPVTFTWSEFWHWYLKRTRQVGETSPPKDRDRPIGISIGILERLVITSLVISLWYASGPLTATWLVSKAAMGWDLTGKKDADLNSRKRYAVHLMNSLVSIFWALAWGAWAAPPR